MQMMDCNHLTDAEWAFLRSYVLTHGRGRPPADHRRVLDGLFWLARTGRPWRDLPREFGNWGSVYRQHQRWSTARVWELASEDVAGCTRLPASHVTPRRTLTEEAVAAAGGHDRLP